MSGAIPLFTTAGLLCRRVNLTELYELVVFHNALCTNERPCVLDVLRLNARVVAAIAHGAHEAESLRAAGKTANEGGGAFVFRATNLNTGSFLHVDVNVPLLRPLCNLL